MKVGDLLHEEMKSGSPYMNAASILGLVGLVPLLFGWGRKKWFGFKPRTWLREEKERLVMFHGITFTKTKAEAAAKLEERAKRCEEECGAWKKKAEKIALGQEGLNDRPGEMAKVDQAQKTLLDNAATLRAIARNLSAETVTLTLDEIEYLGF